MAQKRVGMRICTMQHNGPEKKEGYIQDQNKIYLHKYTLPKLYNFSLTSTNKNTNTFRQFTDYSTRQQNTLKTILAQDRYSSRKERMTDRSPLSQTGFRTPKPRRNLDPTPRLSSRRQTCLSTQRQPNLSYKGWRFKGNKGWGTRYAIQERSERTTRLTV